MSRIYDDNSLAIGNTPLVKLNSVTKNCKATVLAKIEGGPEGIKGVSLFIVPKFMVKEDGAIGERNAVSVGSRSRTTPFIGSK